MSLEKASIGSMQKTCMILRFTTSISTMIFFMEFNLPECLSITQYESISGEELNPYRRLSAGCIKTFIGGDKPYKALIHKKIPIYSIGIEVMPAYYEAI